MPRQQLRHEELPPKLLGPVLVDSTGVLRYWPTAWSALYGGQVRPSTLASKLAAIERLYKHADDLLGSYGLDRAIADLDFDSLETALESFFVKLVNTGQSGTTVGRSQWQSALTFIRNCTDLLVKSYSGNQPIYILQSRLQRLEQLYVQLAPSRRQSVEILRALPAGVVEDLYELIQPEVQRNPFRSDDLRWRNFAIVLLLLHQGLRRGEALNLAADAIKTERERKSNKLRHWVDVNVNPYAKIDTRADPPGFKNANSIRQLPVAAPLAEIVATYHDNYRGRPAHSYLITSQKGNALSLRSFNEVFDTLSDSLSVGAKKELLNRRRVDKISPHDLRHTCAVVRLKQFVESGTDQALAIEHMRVFFGWSRTSDMPRLYARAYFEDRLATIWHDVFDDHVNVLRSVTL